MLVTSIFSFSQKVFNRHSSAGSLNLIAFSLFSHNVFYPIIISAKSNLSAANAFNLVQSKSFSFVKELILFVGAQDLLSTAHLYRTHNGLELNMIDSCTFLCPVSKDRGAYCFTVVCLSVCTNLT